MPHALMDRLGKKLFEEAPLEGYASVSNNNNNNTINSNSILSEEDRWLTENDILQQMSSGSQNLASSNASNLSLPLSASPTLTSGQSEKSAVRGGYQQQQQLPQSSPSRILKRPMLTMHSIQHVRELEFFLSHVAQYVYHTTYTLAKPDKKFIEALIERDMLGGSGMEE